MDYKFLTWCTQVIGSSFGLIACAVSYMFGNLYVFGNPYLTSSDISLNVSICSYILLPLCIMSLLCSFIKLTYAYIPNTMPDTVNTFIMVFNTIIGFIGSGKYFFGVLIFFSISIFFNYKYNEELEFEAYLREKEKKRSEELG